MIEVIYLKPGDQPPADEKVLLIQWKPGEGMSTNMHSLGTTQMVPDHLWSYWLSEGPLMAERMGLTKVYFAGRPDA